MPTTAEKFFDLFRGLSSAYGTHGEPTRAPGKLKWEIKSTARTIRAPVTVDLWQKHLDGETPLGVVAIREDSTCSWGSIDVDQYDRDFSTLLAKVREAELPLVPCRSKSGGLHLFMFTKSPVQAGLMQVVLGGIAAKLGLAGCEIFPKQQRILSSSGDMGSWMVMPYFGGTYGGKLFKQAGIEDGREISADEFLAVAAKRSVTPEAVQIMSVNLADGAAPTARPRRRQQQRGNGADSSSDPSPGDFSDGPPCIQHISSEGGFQEGGRNNAMFHCGVYVQKALPSTWKDKLSEINQQFFRPPLSTAELNQIINSLERKSYEYKCRDEPMKSHCDVAVCRARRFGIGRSSEYPKITRMSRMKSDPVVWFVDIEGEPIELSTSELMDFKKFSVVCAEKLDKFYDMMKHTDWIRILNDARENLEDMEAPAEVGTIGRFVEVLEDFLTNRQTGTRIEDLASGKPFEDRENNEFLFRLKDFQRFLKREDVRANDGRPYTRGQLASLLRNDKIRGGSRVVGIRGTTLSVWFVPSDRIQRPAEASAPPVRRSAI